MVSYIGLGVPCAGVFFASGFSQVCYVSLGVFCAGVICVSVF